MGGMWASVQPATRWVLCMQTNGTRMCDLKILLTLERGILGSTVEAYSFLKTLLFSEVWKSALIICKAIQYSSELCKKFDPMISRSNGCKYRWMLVQADVNHCSATVFFTFPFTDNQAAVVSALSAFLGVVKDAVEEMENVRTPLSYWGTCSDFSERTQGLFNIQALI